jgi:hypothetical protein
VLRGGAVTAAGGDNEEASLVNMHETEVLWNVPHHMKQDGTVSAD